MNAQSGLMVVLGLGALAGIGYAVASSAKDTTPPAGPPLPEPSPVGPLPSYVPQALIDAYEQCYQFGCTQAEYDQIRFGLQELVRTHPEETDLWVFFQDELSRQQVAHNASAPGVTTYADYNTQSAGLGLDFTDPQANPGTQPGMLDLGALGGATGVPLPLPLNFSPVLAVSYVNCWYTRCSAAEFDTLIVGMNQYTARADIDAVSRQQMSLAKTAIFNRRMHQSSGTQGITGRHTGGCSCQARQEEVGTGACCDSCAKGEECSECGDHAPAVG